MKRNTYLFIIHVVNNLFPLNEYSSGEIKNLMNKFKEEADDLNIKIDDARLEAYIQRFDQLKNSPKIQEKDLRKYSLSKLIKLVTSSEGGEPEEEKEDDTPDVVYNENGITIWNGSKEDNCVLYGRGERWCITKGSYGGYRYNAKKGFPTFYLAKNTNLPDENRLSFVAIQVRDVDNEKEKYVYTNRKNSPYESKPMSFSSLMSEIPWLNDIPNIRNILRHIPLSTKEKINQVYGSIETDTSIREWIKFPFSTKKQYLIAKSNAIRNSSEKNLFSDITNNEFIGEYLPKYPQLATFIAITPGIIDSIILLKNLDKFSNQDRKSIIANMHDAISTKELSKETISFPVKKLLVTLNKWQLSLSEKLYVTKDGEAIIKLSFDNDNTRMDIYTAEDDYPDVKLNVRTSKYLTDYPDLDKLPLNNLLKLASDGVISKEIINNILTKAQEDSNSAIVVKDTDTGKIILDSNSFTSYKLENNKISPISFDSEEVQNILNRETDNTSFQNNAITLVFSKEDIPNQIDKDAFYNVLNNISNENKIRNGNIIILDPSSNQIAILPSTPQIITNDIISGFNITSDGSWRRYINSYYATKLSKETWRKYFDYLRSINAGFNDENLKDTINSLRNTENKRNFITALPPMDNTAALRPVNVDDKIYLVNTESPNNSYRLSGATGRLLPISANRSLLARATGTVPAATPAAAGGRRGRPAGVPAAVGAGARVAAPLAPAAGGEANAGVATAIENAGLTTGFNSLPANIRTRISAGNVIPYTRRNTSLDAIGRVTGVVSAGQSRFYILRLPSGRVIGFATMQPDARHYIVTATASYRVPRVSQLAVALQQNNISEQLKTIVKLHAIAMPGEAKQIKEILLNLKNKKK